MVEYLMTGKPINAEQSHYSYQVGAPKNQQRYWWRDASVSDNSPVTVQELNKALSPMLPSSKKQKELNRLLKQYASASVTYKDASDNEKSVEIVSAQDEAKNYDLTPSAVDTMVTVLTFANDAGLDYDLIPGKQKGTLDLKINNTLAPRIRLLDPQHPYLVGSVDANRVNTTYVPQLTRLSYYDYDKNNKLNTKQKTAIGQAFTYNSATDEYTAVNPIKGGNRINKDGSTSAKSYLFNERTLSNLTAGGHGIANSSDQSAPEFSEQVSLGRYLSLDQKTKDAIALAGMSTALGVNPERFNQDTQSLLKNQKIDTIDKLVSDDKNYEATISAGTNVMMNGKPKYGALIATMDTVQLADDSSDDSPVNKALRHNDPQKIFLDARAASVVSSRDDVNASSFNPKIDPYQITDAQADTNMVNGYIEARKTYLPNLLGTVEPGDRPMEDAQKAFVASLDKLGFNPQQTEVLNESGHGQHLEQMKVTDAVKARRQDAVLSALSDGILDAKPIFAENDESHSIAVNDEALKQRREYLAESATDENDRVQKLAIFDELVSQIDHKFGTAPVQNRVVTPETDEFNPTPVIKLTSEMANSINYEFMMAQSMAKSRFKDQLAGNTEFDTLRLMERSVQFNDETAKTREQLLQEDRDPNSAEGKLQAYIKSLNGEPAWFDDPNNPDPAAFSFDGKRLINPVSQNQFKIKMMDAVAERMKARGAEVNDDSIKIDDHGLIHFKAFVPQYESVDHRQKASRKGFVYDDNGNPVEYNNAANVQTVNDPHYQLIEGTIGQVFAPDHAGIVTTNFNRFENGNFENKQDKMIPYYRASYLMPKRNVNGDWDAGAFREEYADGLNQNHRLRLMGYPQYLEQQVKMAAESVFLTKHVGDVTKFNSTTLLNHTYHGKVLNEKLTTELLNAKPSPERQAKIETTANTVKFNESIAQATKATEVSTFAQDIQKYVADGFASGKFKEVPDEIDIMLGLHNPVSIYGNHMIGELAHDSDAYYFANNMTGQGASFGPKRFLNVGTKVKANGEVDPTVFRDENGEMIKDVDGKVVGVQTGAAMQQLQFYDTAYKNPDDRTSVGIEQGMKGRMLTDVKVASMDAGALTQEDGWVVSKAFAESQLVTDQEDEDGDPIYRPLKEGDKLSDQGGNKATISKVIDPELDPKTADEQGVGDLVALMKANPELEVINNGTSQMSRNNGSMAYGYLHNDRSKPMSFTPMRKQADGSYAPGEPVQTNATINSGQIIVTNQLINHKVTLYDKYDEKRGRKMSSLVADSDNAKGAVSVANYFRKDDNSLQKLRNYLLASGVDLDADGFKDVDYAAVAKETSSDGQAKFYQYDIDNDAKKAFKDAQFGNVKDSVTKELKSVPLLRADKPEFSRGATKLVRFVDGNRKDAHNPRVFDGLDKTGKLTDKSKDFIDALSSRFKKSSPVAYNADNQDPNKYNAGSDFLKQLPNGGVLKFPDGITIKNHNNDDVLTDSMYILPDNMRRPTRALDDTTIQSDFNKKYQQLGTKLANYKLMHDTLNDPQSFIGKQLQNNAEMKQQVDQYLSDSLGIENTVNAVQTEIQEYAFGENNPKTGFFKNDVLGGYPADTATSQAGNNANLPLDTIEVSPAIAKRLGYVAGKDGYAHVKDHPDWDRVHVHRDPVWRGQGALGFRMKVNDSLIGTRVSPVMFSMMDGDHDGDNVGLIAMKDEKSQYELKQVMSVDQWLLDANAKIINEPSHNLLNINAELVDSAHNTNNKFIAELADGSKVSGQFNDMEFRQKVVDNVRPNLRSEVKDVSARGKDGYLKYSDSDFLNLLVDNTIQNHYDRNDTHGARQGVDEIVNRSLGYETERSKSGEVVRTGVFESMLKNDGIDYSTRETMNNSLKRYIGEGAKGSDSKLKKLNEYMDLPKASEIRALGYAQVKDGKLDQAAHERYLTTYHDQVSAYLLPVQKATKIKSDVTGVPGNHQKKFTGMLVYQGVDGLQAAASLGQPLTQNILSIKHSPKEAGQSTELLQFCLKNLTAGKKDQTFKTFAAMGPESNGDLGSDVLTASERIAKLRNEFKVQDQATPISKYTRQQTIDLAGKIGIKYDKDVDDAVLDTFKQNVDDVTHPYLKSIKPNKDGSDKGLTRQELINGMDEIYNGKMHLNVAHQYFDDLSVALTNGDTDKNAPVQNIDDLLKSNGSAATLAKLNFDPRNVIADSLAKQHANQAMNATRNPEESLFGAPDSKTRATVWGGLSNDVLTQQLQLDNHTETTKSETLQKMEVQAKVVKEMTRMQNRAESETHAEQTALTNSQTDNDRVTKTAATETKKSANKSKVAALVSGSTDALPFNGLVNAVDVKFKTVNQYAAAQVANQAILLGANVQNQANEIITNSDNESVQKNFAAIVNEKPESGKQVGTYLAQGFKLQAEANPNMKTFMTKFGGSNIASVVDDNQLLSPKLETVQVSAFDKVHQQLNQVRNTRKRQQQKQTAQTQNSNATRNDLTM